MPRPGVWGVGVLLWPPRTRGGCEAPLPGVGRSPRLAPGQPKPPVSFLQGTSPTPPRRAMWFSGCPDRTPTHRSRRPRQVTGRFITLPLPSRACPAPCGACPGLLSSLSMGSSPDFLRALLAGSVFSGPLCPAISLGAAWPPGGRASLTRHGPGLWPLVRGLDLVGDGL